MKKKKISVGICCRSYNRNLFNLLINLKKNYKPQIYKLNISIIFNTVNKIKTSESNQIKKILSNVPHEILYERMKGVSFARNKYLNRIKNISVDFCCFIDDDCIPQKNFILNHLKFITKEKCKIVTGPQIFKSKITFFRILERRFRQGDTIRWASTNNVFFKKSLLQNKLLFSTKVIKYGYGEDQLFFSKLSKNGEKIKWHNNKVYEIVGKERKNLSWFLKRNFSYGLTGYLIERELYGNIYGIFVNLFKSLIYLFYLVIYLAIIIFNPKKYFLLSMSNLLRVCGRIIGLKNIIK